MANITGTNGKDTLIGTAADDIIKGLGGNDTIIGSFGEDTIDGGAGYDTVDYSGSNFNDSRISLILNDFDGSLRLSGDRDSTLVNIEKVIANKSTFEFNSRGLFFRDAQDIDVDLSNNRLTYSVTPLNQSTGTIRKTITVENFQDIASGRGTNRIKGNDLNNSISLLGGNNTIIGTKGDDSIVGDSLGSNTTLDYSSFGTAVDLLLPIGQLSLSVSKGDFGIDRTISVQKVIGAINKANTVTAEQFTPLDVNLAKNIVQGASNGKPVEIINFVNVVGRQSNDKIVGSNKGGKFTGSGGDDIITGGKSNDIINGTDDNYRGVGEVDTLTGGGGLDKFALGDKNGAYYVGNGNNDYALITDFNLFQDSISIGNLKNYSFSAGGNNTIELYSGKDVNTRDLIAKIQLAGGISVASSNSRSRSVSDGESIVGTNPSLDSIVAKIDIISGT